MRIPAISPKSARIDSETPSDTTCATNHTRDARGITTSSNITTCLQLSPQETDITAATPTSQETNIQHKDPNHTEDQIRPSMDKIQIGLRVLKITSGIHNPAQAKPEG